MKHCNSCNGDFDIDETVCPICGAPLEDALSTAEIVTAADILGII